MVRMAPFLFTGTFFTARTAQSSFAESLLGSGLVACIG
jgi:hypothetical protein